MRSLENFNRENNDGDAYDDYGDYDDYDYYDDYDDRDDFDDYNRDGRVKSGRFRKCTHHIMAPQNFQLQNIISHLANLVSSKLN